MAGTVLGIGETNPKRGAVQYDPRRIDGLRLYANAAATLQEFPIGTIVSIQEETTTKKQIAVVGAKAYDGDEYSTYAVIRVGVLEVSTQNSGAVNQAVGSVAIGDFCAVVSDNALVYQVPTASGAAPASGGLVYANPNGQAAATVGGGANVAINARAYYGTPGVQASNQLKSGYAFMQQLVPGLLS